jgi:hypothetical protein
MIGGWRTLHKVELHHLYFSPNIISVIKLRRVCWETSMHGEKMNTYRILLGLPEAKKPLRNPRRRSVDNINGILGN